MTSSFTPPPTAAAEEARNTGEREPVRPRSRPGPASGRAGRPGPGRLLEWYRDLRLSLLGRFGMVLGAVAVGLGLLGGRTTDTSRVDGYGIIFALPTVYWVGVGLAAVASVVLLHVALTERTRYASLVPLVWLGVLHTGPHLAHDHFRFNTVWTHIGFVRVIGETRSSDVLIDARFAWPGFFGVFMGPLTKVNEPTLELIMRLWPTAVLLATGLLVSALAVRSYPTVPLIGPMSAVVYLLLAWTGQDYFSPQSFGFTAYLSILVLMESGPLRTSPAWSASVPFLARFAAAGGDRPAPRSTPAFVSLLLLSFGAVVSHPLAPFFVCMGLVILGLYGRTVAWRMLVMVAVAYVTWFFVSAEPWWSTQLEGMISQIGSIFGNLESTTSARVAKSSPEHLFVANVRSIVGLSTFLVVLVIGIAMATERFRHLRPAIPLAPLAGIPSMAMMLQSYGGEIIFRVVLFTLPMAAILVARMLVAVRVRALPLLIPLLALAMTPWLLIARFGNEAFEMTTATDRAAMLAVYDAAQEDALVVADNGFVPFVDQTVGRNRFTEISSSPDEEWIEKLERFAEDTDKSRIIIVFTPSQVQWRIHGISSPPDYLDEVGAWLKARPGVTVLYEAEGALVVEL